MSYILEALKKAQHTRERGQVPRLERALREPPPGAAAPSRVGFWSALALALALTALAVALYAAWQVATPPPVPQPVRDQTAAVLAPPPEANPAPAPARAPDEPAAPRVLVVPAPRADGQPLARGAEELRRAVLGEPPPLPPAAPPPARAAPVPTVPAATPVPPALRAEIAAFKHQVGRQPPLPVVPAPPAAATDDAPTRHAPPTPGPHWPAIALNVHVYDDDPTRRFVYINGVKLHEGETAPNGVTVERVLADGVWLGYRGERFFQPR